MSKEYSRRKFIGMSGLLGIIPATLSANLAMAKTGFARGDRSNPLLPDMERIKALLKGVDPLTWLFTGDSITHGAKHTNGYRSFPEIFGERVRWEMRRTRDVVINTGISGNITDNILSDFQWRIAQFKPAVVSVMIGTNDCARANITTEDYKSDLINLIDKIRELNAVPILHTPNFIDLEKAPRYARLPEFAKVVQELAVKNKLILVDNWAYWKEASRKETENAGYKKWLEDPIHPDAKGHVEIARLLFKVLDIFDPKAATCAA
jgi:acyl-CoA thioesterase-1